MIEAEVQGLLAARGKLMAAMQRLGETGKGRLMSRIHGDFHLGQVLVVSADAYIIDFEGEPSRPLAERRGKANPLRDAAGLLRSIDYAAATTLDPKNLAAARLPEATRRKFVTRLREGAERAFLRAYREATSGLPDLGGPDLLDFFLIEKAAYEIGYEAANRPSWLPVPVGGLARLVSRVLAPAQGGDL
jgi:maltose alpha-D-glucosyltransferase / alpha-amylase